MKIVKKIFKYATGQEIPKGAIYLNTIVETMVPYKNIHIDPNSSSNFMESNTSTRLVWHYFLVNVIE